MTKSGASGPATSPSSRVIQSHREIVLSVDHTHRTSGLSSLSRLGVQKTDSRGGQPACSSSRLGGPLSRRRRRFRHSRCSACSQIERRVIWAGIAPPEVPSLCTAQYDGNAISLAGLLSGMMTLMPSANTSDLCGSAGSTASLREPMTQHTGFPCRSAERTILRNF